MRQFRLVHVGVAAALAAATVTSVGLVQSVGAAGSGTASVLVSIVPCRLFDTRASADNNVGTRNIPLGPGEAAAFAVWGTNGKCTIPSTATGIATNATAVNPTAASYITIYPADADPRPTASNLNVTAGGAPTPNQVTVGLSATGTIAAFNNAGTVDLIVDIVGYYQAEGGGAIGPQGPPGPAGINGTNGAAGPACPEAGCTVTFSGFDAIGASTYSALDCVGGITTVRLPLDLPPGATLSKVTIRYNDRDTAAGAYEAFSLTRASLGPAVNGATVSSVASSVDQGFRLDLSWDSSTTPPTGPQYSYYVTVTAASASPNLYFCGADVTYHF